MTEVVWKAWKAWSLIWILILILLSFVAYHLTGWIPVFSLIPLTLWWIYEIVFIRGHLEKERIGLRAKLIEQMESYEPKEKDYSMIMEKIQGSLTTLSSLTSVSFALLVFSLGFIYVAKFELGPNLETFTIFVALTSLLVAGILYLISLDQYDTAADPSLKVKVKWEMRKLTLNYFVFGWYFLVFGILTLLSLIHPFLTFVGCFSYIVIHNCFWFQVLR